MKKKLIVFLSLLVMFVTGCGNNMSAPSEKVEEFLGRYQSMDSNILTQLDNVISNDETMDDTQKKDYKTLMEKQYQNLSYKIKDETIDNLIKSKEELIKSNKTNVISLKLQNEKYQEIIEKLTKTN